MLGKTIDIKKVDNGYITETTGFFVNETKIFKTWPELVHYITFYFSERGVGQDTNINVKD